MLEEPGYRVVGPAGPHCTFVPSENKPAAGSRGSPNQGTEPWEPGQAGPRPTPASWAWASLRRHGHQQAGGEPARRHCPVTPEGDTWGQQLDRGLHQ